MYVPRTCPRRSLGLGDYFVFEKSSACGSLMEEDLVELGDAPPGARQLLMEFVYMGIITHFRAAPSRVPFGMTKAFEKKGLLRGSESFVSADHPPFALRRGEWDRGGAHAHFHPLPWSCSCWSWTTSWTARCWGV